MLFSKKSPSLFVDLNDHTFALARTSSSGTQLVIEEMKSCPAGDASAIASLLESKTARRGGVAGLTHAACAIYPRRRLVRRATLDPKRFREADYLNEVVSTQFRIEPEKYTLAALNASNGTDFDLANGTSKEALFAGLPAEEIRLTQKHLLGLGLFPTRLELGTVATLGGVMNYLRRNKMEAPTLVLEVDTESTNAYILSASGVDTSRPIAQGLDAMIPVVQKELGLKDEESARKLFYSNTFDFTGMGPSLIKRLIKELQSSIGFYEVQTGQSIGQVICTLLPPKMGWLQGAIASQLGVGVLEVDVRAWLGTQGVVFSPTITKTEIDTKNMGLLSLILPHSNASAPEEKS